MTQPRPDWVVLGCPTVDGKVTVFASKDLNQVELERETEALRDWSGRFVRGLTTRTTLTVEMRTYVVVIGDTYEQALRRLFEAWTPEPDDRPAIEAPRAIGQPFAHGRN